MIYISVICDTSFSLKKGNQNDSLWASRCLSWPNNSIANTQKRGVLTLIPDLPNTIDHLSFGSDTCEIQAEFVFLRSQIDGFLELICYRFLIHNNAEGSFDTTEKKFIVAVCYVFFSRSLLERIRITIPTDHDLLNRTLGSSYSCGRVAQRPLQRLMFDTDVVYDKGL